MPVEETVMRLFWVLLLFIGSAVAQCPVKFERVRAAEPTQQVHARWSRYYFDLKWKNVSDEEIVGAKFEPIAYDATREPHPFGETWGTDQKAKPGQSHHTSWEDTFYVETRVVDGKYAAIRLVK